MLNRILLVGEIDDEIKGGVMSLDNARIFVAQLRENNGFRLKTLATSGPEELTAFLQAENLVFNQRELVGAMAECMEQLEKRECC